MNMVQMAVEHAAGCKAGSRISILATEATLQSRIYHDRLALARCDAVQPDPQDQDAVGAAIFNSAFGIKATGMILSPLARQTLEAVVQRMQQSLGIDHVLLGCTELSFAFLGIGIPGVTVIDPVDVVAQACLRQACQKPAL